MSLETFISQKLAHFYSYSNAFLHELRSFYCTCTSPPKRRIFGCNIPFIFKKILYYFLLIISFSLAKI